MVNIYLPFVNKCAFNRDPETNDVTAYAAPDQAGPNSDVSYRNGRFRSSKHQFMNKSEITITFP